MKFIAFLLLVMVALGVSWLTFADTATFEEFGRWIMGTLACLLWVCAGVWLFGKIEMGW